MMKKSWGDDCSSDEESHRGDEADDEAELLDEPPITEDAIGGSDGGTLVEKTYDYPDRPPYTAFIGNLSFKIKDEKQLEQAVADVVFQRFGEKIDVIGGHISYDRVDPNKHRGFGYVEVETLDQLKLLMKLDDGQTMIAGRVIQINLANNKANNNNNRRGSNSNYQQRGSYRDNNNARGGSSTFRDGNSNPPGRGSYKRNSQGGTAGAGDDIDGSKFRGGRYNRGTSSGSLGGSGSGIRQDGGGSFRNDAGPNNSNQFRGRSNSNIGDRNEGGLPPAQQGQATSGPASTASAIPQRPSLKLAPRTKPPVDDSERLAGSSDIFGGAKARDEQAWQQSRRTSEKQQSQELSQNEPSPAAGKEEVGVTVVAVKQEEVPAPAVVSPIPTKDEGETEKEAVKDEEDNIFAPVSSSATNNNSNKSNKAGQRNTTGRGGRGRGGGRGGGGGGRQQDKGDYGNRQRGSQSGGRRGPQQEKRQQQPSGRGPKADDKVAVAGTAAAAQKSNGAAAASATAPPKKAEPTNKFALLMDSDSD